MNDCPTKKAGEIRALLGGEWRLCEDILKHEALASPEEMIIEYLESPDQIVNRQARIIPFSVLRTR